MIGEFIFWSRESKGELLWRTYLFRICAKSRINGLLYNEQLLTVVNVALKRSFHSKETVKPQTTRFVSHFNNKSKLWKSAVNAVGSFINNKRIFRLGNAGFSLLTCFYTTKATVKRFQNEKKTLWRRQKHTALWKTSRSGTRRKKALNKKASLKTEWKIYNKVNLYNLTSFASCTALGEDVEGHVRFSSVHSWLLS